MKLWLIRHGETEWNHEKRFQGQADIPLNDYGRELARWTRDGMPRVAWDRVFASPLGRAFETAEILLDGLYPIDRIIRDRRLMEFNFGPHEGADITEAASNPAHPLYTCLHHPGDYHPTDGAESFESLVARGREFLEQQIVPLESACDHVLIVAHGALLRSLMIAARIPGHSIANFWGAPYYNCCVSRLDLSGQQFTLDFEAKIYYNPEHATRSWTPAET